jgi:predicted ATPase/class 3 adenylate cyclase/Tfp pilus assembly protein PilF
MPDSPSENSLMQPPLGERRRAAQLPTGVITLVFTDIEGSTQLWERYPDTFGAALATHNELARSVLARWDGYEVKSQGDSFMLAFERVTSAIYFAIELQRELAETSWSLPSGAPRVRVGIHTGEPFRGYDAAGRPDYFGPMVNRAARIADAGHGGQILLSASTRDIAGGALSTDVETVDLGFHRLRGIEAPEQIYEVRHPDLFDAITNAPRTFPPLRTSDALRSNLPIYSTSFVGRSRELPELCEMLNQPDTRLLTVIGFGGMGKTRLTLQLAERCSSAFIDGAWWVALDEVWESEAMIARIAYHVGLQIQPQPSLKEQLLEFLRPRRLLLILDNVEQVEGAAQVISELLKSAPHIKCVVTSRRALDLQIERVREVLPLPVSDATNLFVDRACAQMQFQLTGDNADDVAELCRRMEGIPLAIELAASRATTLSPREILHRLDERAQVLESNSPDLPARQRALHAAMDWSHSLLSPADQDLFAQTSVFTGGFSLDDAEAVCRQAGSTPDAPELSILEGVARLRAHSLLRSETMPQTQQTRYFMLEALRDYAYKKLLARDAEANEIAARHVAYFLKFAQERVSLLRGPNAQRAIAEIEASFDNIRTATDWSGLHGYPAEHVRLCLALGTFLQCRGFGHEALRRLLAGQSQLLKIRDDGVSESALTPREYSRLQGALRREIAGVHLDHFQWSKARSIATSARENFADAGDARGIAQAINLLGLCDKAEGDFGAAREKFASAQEMFIEQGDRIGEAIALNNLGLVEFGDQNGDPGKANDYWQQALQIHRDLNDQRGVAQVLTNLGALAQKRGEAEVAWSSFVEALRWERELHHVIGVARTLSNLGEIAEMKTESARAHRLFLTAQFLFNQVGSPYEKYVIDLLGQLNIPLAETEDTAHLREKSLDDLVRWALEIVR